jgi:hypothetical protein
MDGRHGTTAIGRPVHEDDGPLLAGSRLSVADRVDSRRTTGPDPNAPVVHDRYRATNRVRGVLPEDLLVGEGGGQITVGVGLGE